MSKSMYCPNCGAYVGDCGHVSGGLTGPATLSGTCGKCNQEYSVTCNGDCLSKSVNCKTCKGRGTVVIHEKETCPSCDGSGTVLDHRCITCHGSGTISVPAEVDCPDC